VVTANAQADYGKTSGGGINVISTVYCPTGKNSIR